jgi:hypothetical protein
LAEKQRIYVQFLREARDFSVPQSIQSGSEVHPASYSVDTGGSFLGRKVAAA